MVFPAAGITFYIGFLEESGRDCTEQIEEKNDWKKFFEKVQKSTCEKDCGIVYYAGRFTKRQIIEASFSWSERSETEKDLKKSKKLLTDEKFDDNINKLIHTNESARTLKTS